MKKFQTYKLLLVSALLLGALPGVAQNNIEMVTYFPTPRLQINNILVSEQFDVGTTNNTAFELNLGSSESDNPSLQIDPAVQTILSTNTVLGLPNFLYTETATFGQGNSDATLQATNAFVYSQLGAVNAGSRVQSITTQNATVNGSVNLINNNNNTVAFPDCSAKYVFWKKIGNHTYLVCSNSEPTETAGDTCTWENKQNVTQCQTTSTGNDWKALWTNNQNDALSVLAALLVDPNTTCSAGKVSLSGGKVTWSGGESYATGVTICSDDPTGPTEHCLAIPSMKATAIGIQSCSGSQSNSNKEYCSGDNPLTVTWFTISPTTKTPPLLYQAQCSSTN